ncbi:MAG: HAMP domain-containing protein [Acidobacteriia bacterium]|nr:HAMP domain-containing protein [Terriglobia bacterium]
MKSLFLRIFLSFWAAQALFVVLAILVTIAIRPARHTVENTAPQILAEVVNAYQNGGERGAFDYEEELHRTQGVRGFVFDPTGRELAGRMPPPWVEEIRRGGAPRHRGWIESLLPPRISRQALTLDGKRYTLVLELPPGRTAFFGPHDIPGLGIFIAVISSGLVCYLLAWSMTSPVARLRRAAQSLAAGDLTARSGAPVRGRRDELAELMRDFDRMAERIEGLVESQSRLLKDVSHELRSPLARLSVALGLAQQRAGPEIEASLKRIEIEADRLNQLIQRLLTISRLESGTDGIHKTKLSLRELVDHVARDAEYETPGRGCRVSADGADEFLVEGDPELLRSAIENVVRNATRYTAEGTLVEIRLERQTTSPGEEVVIRVLDSGPGVPSEALERIFQPFYRLDDARNRQTGGAGLGLSIADRAVRLHGGQLRASNRPEGGLEVEIRIPAVSGFALPAHS